MEDLTIRSGDRELAARLFLPSGEVQIAHVLHGATGVPRDYYQPFAEWLAREGRACLIYAYRGAGDGPAALRQDPTDMSDWGITDQAAALDALITRFPQAEIRVIGHSLGGFMTMFHENADKVAEIAAVCSGPAYWARTPFPHVFKAWFFWMVLGPVLTLAKGYMPGRGTGIGADIPAAAFWQWRRWCTNRHMHKPGWGRDLPMPDLERFGGRLRLIGVSDDWLIAPAVVHDLGRFYPRAAVEKAVIDPGTLGLGPVGHLSVFRPRNAAAWPMILGER